MPTSGHGRPKARSLLGLVSLKQERLARKVTLAFGFLSFIPLMLIILAFVQFVFPYVEHAKGTLNLFIAGSILSILVGYWVLKRTIGAVMEVVSQARVVARQQGDAPAPMVDGDEISELARTFHHINQELEHKIQELESSRTLIKRLLSRIGTAIVSYEGIDSLLGLILENTAVALGAQMGSLMLINGEKQELEVKTSWSVRHESVTAQRLKLGEGIAGMVAKEGRPMRGIGSSSAVGLVNGQTTDQAILCVPMVIRDRTIGIISVVRDDPARPFSEDDELLLANIGSQIAVAIENYRLNLDMERTYLETIMALALAVEAKDSYSAGHSKRVGWYAVKIAEALGADEQTKKILQEAGLLHDVGKIGIKDDILLKAGGLTPEETQIMHQHPVIGEAILKPVRSLSKVADLIRYHHEQFDGSGYPYGLKGEAIPFEARILTVADTYDSMMTDRPYRKRLSFEQAVDELRRGSGKQFDPAVVEVFLNVLADKQTRQLPTSPG